MTNHSGLFQQRGGVSLIVALLLLVAMTITAFAANKNLIFEQKTSANQYRSARALEAAEAGLEWALSNLNYMSKVGGSCTPIATPATTDKTFRQLYLDSNADGVFDPLATQVIGCVRGSTGWTCSCPTSGTAPTFPSCSLSAGCPTFAVQFASVAGQASVIEVRSTGCTTNLAPCVPGAASNADATATARLLVKVRPSLTTPPAAPLTAKGNVNFGSAAITVTNTDTGTNGVTINAGGTIDGTVGSNTIKTLPGSPVESSLVGNDSSLSSLSDDDMFKTFFGQSKEAFKAAASTVETTCPSTCTSHMSALLNSGVNTVWVEGDMDLNSNAVFGSPTNPVIVVVNGNAHLNGNMTIYGVVYSTNLTWDNTGGGGAKIVGAAIAEGNFTTTGTPDPTYDAKVLSLLKTTTGDFVKVPGSWRDF